MTAAAMTDGGSSATEALAHQSHLVSSLSSLYLSEELADVRLAVNGGPPFPAHRFVLALGSAVFRAMLWGGRWADGRPRGTGEGPPPLVRLTEEDEGTAAHFPEFLRYLYTGRLALGVANAPAVRTLAEKYDAPALRAACDRFLLERVPEAGAQGLALQWRRYALFAGLPALERACDDFLAHNLEAVAAGDREQWRGLEPAQLAALLRRSDLVVESELALAQHVLRWLEGRPESAPDLLPLLRYPQMSGAELEELRAAPGSPGELLAQLARAQGLGVSRESVLGKEAVSRLHGLDSRPLCQRLYTARPWGAPWRLDFFSSLTKTVLCKEFTTSGFRVQSKWFLTFHPKGERLVVQEERPVRGSVRLPAPPGAKRRCCCCPGLYERVLKDNDRAALHCKIVRCHSGSRATHEHQVSVLFYRCLAGRWLVCDLKTFNVPHWQDVKIDDLLPAPERGKYVSQAEDTLSLHLIGHTNWRKI
ncbi:BTB/POZ domain-containing protein 17-like [Chiloscyllium plagiosum]|uniref:BTB/POZ domain-containing protein 17-like n=1 Tax=Chiloscyllium plagiosum TaxID=36176 RepID=UPI001CB843BC|nr:BTB/POZ domain-containing protein 17-like [Chiloscyllium plagiosum]